VEQESVKSRERIQLIQRSVEVRKEGHENFTFVFVDEDGTHAGLRRLPRGAGERADSQLLCPSQWNL
jgi:hypothetical protein